MEDKQIIKIAVSGLVDNNLNETNLVETKAILRTLPNLDVIGFRKHVHDIINCKSQKDDSGGVIDRYFDVAIDAIDTVDALLIVSPKILPVSDMAMFSCEVNYLGWAGFLSGYAWSQGKPTLLYSPENHAIKLSVPLARVIQATLYTQKELIEYDWMSLPYRFNAEVVI